MDNPLSPRTRWLAIRLLIAALVLAVLAIGAYFLTFGPRTGFHLSKYDTAWANFGNYTAGVLGPLFAFLAFVGVLLTVNLQAEQLDSARKQARLEEIQSVLATVADRIDGLLAQPPNQHIDHQALKNAPITVYSIISAIGIAAISTATDPKISESSKPVINTGKEAVQTEMIAIVNELEQLAWCLQQYERETGSAIVVEFYKRRFASITCWIDALVSLADSPHIQTVFTPQDLRKQFSVPVSALSSLPDASG